MPDSQLGTTYQIDVQCYNCDEKTYNMSIEKGILLTEADCKYCGCKRLHKIEQHQTATDIQDEQRGGHNWTVRNFTARELNRTITGTLPTSNFTPGQVSTLTIEEAERPD